MMNLSVLMPKLSGYEKYDISAKSVKAHSGTGFNQDNPQHFKGSDVVRYAIAIQQHRDAKDYILADFARVMATSHNFSVVNRPNYTEIVNMSGEDWSVVEDAETGAQILMGAT